MFVSVKSAGEFTSMPPGVDIRTLVWGESTLLAQFVLKKGGELPRHSHPFEQTGYLLSGKLRFFIGEETFEAGPGDSWSIPKNMEHAAQVIEDAIAIEVFSPVREDYLPENLRK